MRDYIFGTKKKKNMKKIRQVSGTRISGTAGATPLNLICKVLYIKALKYVELVEIGVIVFEL